ncbi:MAG TPA: 50S ribosomal protein L25 [Kiritimatiellia bacterium]|nr:50S ribosomal protein L25 [Kiritimatiellia bacterium]
MANEQIRLKAEPRTEQGSVAVGRLRRAGSIPAAVNRIGGDTTLLKLNTHAFIIMLRHHANEQMLVTLDLDGQEIPALMREVQYDVMTGHPIHVDFGEISLSKKIRVSIPLHLAGEPEGVKLGGGILQQMLRSVEVECLPAEIVETFNIDVTALKVGQSIFARDLKLGDAYTVITSKDAVVTTVAAPEEDAAASTAEGAPTPEVINKGKKEEGAEGAASAAKK